MARGATTLGVYAVGKRVASLELTSRFGWFYGAYPFSNDPADGRGHHMFDENRLLLGRTLPAGSKVPIAVGPQDAAACSMRSTSPTSSCAAAACTACRLAERHCLRCGSVRPKGQRERFGRSRRRRPQAACAAVDQPRTYRIDRHLIVDQVTILGAGAWYTVLRGSGVAS